MAQVQRPRSHEAATAAAAATAELRLLGSFGLTPPTGDRPDRLATCPVAVRLPRAPADQPQSRRQVSFLLWPDASEAQARNSLRQLLHQVRPAWPGAERYLPPTRARSRSARTRGLDVDVDEYEAAVAPPPPLDEHADPPAQRAAFARAADLYRGDLLPGLRRLDRPPSAIGWSRRSSGRSIA